VCRRLEQHCLGSGWGLKKSEADFLDILPAPRIGVGWARVGVLLPPAGAQGHTGPRPHAEAYQHSPTPLQCTHLEGWRRMRMRFFSVFFFVKRAAPHPTPGGLPLGLSYAPRGRCKGARLLF
jgi:hypothetical protein